MVPAAHMASNPVIGILLAMLPPLAFAPGPPFPPPSPHVLTSFQQCLSDMENMTLAHLKDLDTYAHK